jgi:hypothetical protein
MIGAAGMVPASGLPGTNPHECPSELSELLTIRESATFARLLGRSVYVGPTLLVGHGVVQALIATLAEPTS